MSKAKDIVLLVNANPKDTITEERRPLRLDELKRKVVDCFLRSEYREYKVESVPAARIKDLRRALLQFSNCKILHFSGHGNRLSYLLFENEIGNSQRVKPEALSSFFANFSDQLNCVVLAACYSEDQAKAIAKHINFVIGMKEAIQDKAVIEFSEAFYDAIGARYTIEEAFNLGVNAIEMSV